MQSSYNMNMAIGSAGMLADSGFHDVVSRNAALSVPFGTFVTRDTSDTNCKNPTTSGGVTTPNLGGVALSTSAVESVVNGGVPAYPAKGTISVLKKGRVWVKVEEAVVQGDQAFVRYAAGTFAQLGAFRKSADTATAAALPGAYFETSAGIGGLAILNLNMP